MHAGALQDQIYRVGCELVRRSALVLVLPSPDSDNEDAAADCAATAARGHRNPNPTRNLDPRHRRMEHARSAYEHTAAAVLNFGTASWRRLPTSLDLNPRNVLLDSNSHPPNRWPLAGEPTSARPAPGALAAPSWENPNRVSHGSGGAPGRSGEAGSARHGSEPDAALWPDPWGLRIGVVPHHALRD